MKEQHWQDYVVAVIGLYVFMTPWIIPLVVPALPITGAVAYAHYASGLVLMLAAIASVVQGKTWEEVTILLVGLCMVFSPWMLNFTEDQGVTWNIVTCGVAVALLSGTALIGGRYPMRPI